MTRNLRLLLTLVLGAAWALSLGVVPAQAGAGCHSGAFSDEATTRLVAANNCFVPTVARVPTGATVTWISTDDADHTVTAASGGFVSPDTPLRKSAPMALTFERPGVYPYVCVLHPMMAGAIVVGEGPQVSAAGVPGGGETGGGSASATVLGVAGMLMLLAVTAPRLARRRAAAAMPGYPAA